MENLVIKNQTGKDVTTSLIVAEVFEKRHADVLRDIQNLQCSEEFRVRNFAFMFNIRELPNNGSKKDPVIEMTKDGFSFLVMGYTGEKAGQFKEKFIAEFNKREAMLKSDDYILMRSQEILNNRMKALEQQLHQKDAQLELQSAELKQAAPKVDYYDSVLQTSNLISTTIIAKDLGMSARTLNEKLHAKGVIYKSGGVWVLYSKYEDKGYTHTKTHKYTDSHGVEQTSLQTYWTEKGREFVTGLFKLVAANT